MSTATDLAFILKRPFAEQVAFFRGKLRRQVPTETWRDLWKAEHDRAFMVAGAAKADLLADLAAAVQAAIESGESIEQFRARFGDIVQKRGWQGWTGEGTQAGTNWRTRIIYRTNMATSYAAGRHAQLQDFPLWVYRHSGAEHPRLQHKAWNGLTLPKDHPFWQTHYPPNGWGCGCRVFGARSERGASRVGGQPDYTEPPEGWNALDPKTGEPAGIDEGWGYAPGASVADKFRGVIPEMVDELPEGKPLLPPICPLGGRGAHARVDGAPAECPGPLPKPRPFDKALILEDGHPAQYYIDAFLECFPADEFGRRYFTDATGKSLLITHDMFVDRKHSTPQETVYKIFKDGQRHRYVRMLAETIRDPQEIWQCPEEIWLPSKKKRVTLRRRYLALWDVDGMEHPGLSVFELSEQEDLWTGVTTFSPQDMKDGRSWQDYVQRQRVGGRMFKK